MRVGARAERSCMQRPDLVRIEAQIKHSERKREKAQQELDRLRQTEDEQKRKLQSLQADLQVVKRAANAAQGASCSHSPAFQDSKRLNRGTAQSCSTELIAK